DDLWKRLDAARLRHEVDWRWGKGHAGHELNERAPELAREGLKDTGARAPCTAVDASAIRIAAAAMLSEPPSEAERACESVMASTSSRPEIAARAKIPAAPPPFETQPRSSMITASSAPKANTAGRSKGPCPSFEAFTPGFRRK